MSKSEDINTLYRRFGGNADTYQEIVSADHAQAAEAHWPMLGQIKPFSQAEIPAARRSQPTGERMSQVEVVIYKSVPQVVYVPAEPAPAPEQPAPVAEAVPAPHAEPEVMPVPPAFEPQPAQLPPPVAAPVIAATGLFARAGEAKTDLKRVFDRMLPTPPEPETPKVASPLKRLIKW